MIEVSSLSKSFGNKVVVDNISFTVSTGETVCLVGTSGCGKTTTLKLINRLIPPSSGKIIVGGEDADSYSPTLWRRNIGYVVQKAGLFPHLTVFENISLLSKNLKKPKSFIKNRVEELMELIQLDYKDYKDFYPRQLSGGQQQRVGIARALMENPPVILMDEPFGALDPLTTGELHQEILRLNNVLKKTILMVSHDLDEAFKLGDRIILMDQGTILQVGTKKDFLENPANSFVEDFVKGVKY